MIPGLGTGQAATGATAPPAAPNAHFPTQEPDVVREVVGVSHGNIARLKQLVDRQPSLSRAAWDWGFGDWESALGAASHVGNREIAEYLLSKGARPSIFSATMLGQLDVVKAFIAAQPGVQKTWGPHGITLLSHAQAGGDRAKPVLDYLTALGDANERPALKPMTDEEMKALAGIYAFGSWHGREDRNCDRPEQPRVHPSREDSTRADAPRLAGVLPAWIICGAGAICGDQRTDDAHDPRPGIGADRDEG